MDTRVRTEEAQAKATSSAAQEEEGIAKDPYAVTETSLAPRCPHCAYELDPPDSRICLHCGYDMIRRQRRASIKTFDRTGGDWFMWLLPGIACLLAFLLIIGFGIYYHYYLPSQWFARWDAAFDAAGGDRFKVVEKVSEESLWVYLFHPGIEVWLYVFFIWLLWKSGKFALKRLVLNYMPPERIKEK